MYDLTADDARKALTLTDLQIRMFKAGMPAARRTAGRYRRKRDAEVRASAERRLRRPGGSAISRRTRARSRTTGRPRVAASRSSARSGDSGKTETRASRAGTRPAALPHRRKVIVTPLTQRERVLRALINAGAIGITELDFDAPADGGSPIRRLASRFEELRHDDAHNIVTLRDRQRVARYVLRADPLARPSESTSMRVEPLTPGASAYGPWSDAA